MTSTTAHTVLFDETGGPEVLKVRELELAAPAPGEVLIKVEALGLNRADALFRAGTYYYPATLPASRNGYEAAGVIEAVGEGVTAFAPGDTVLTTGNLELSAQGVYADRVVLPQHAVARRPADVDAVTAAAVWLTYTTAYGALHLRAGMRPGDHVLITGASSGVGTAALQVVRRAGATPIATTRTEDKRQQLLDLGAEHVIVTDTEDIPKETKRLTEGRGADIILDAIGGPAFQALGEAAAEDATYILYGWLDGRPTTIPMTWPVTVHGYNNAIVTDTEDGRRRAAAYLNSGLRDGTLRPRIAKVFEGLAHMPDAHRLMETNTHIGKIVVRP
ncbi:zinc-dependent alcohol dehydrogenase family protein [Streptomyces aureoverticillatus]|uniref:zinc-dependent alcohol dehydrogenase family protein n=1 Tax=Streptomyces aureoverticillatus TaxID=66871 RepID=UPI0013DAAA58|nr:zinc-dependent alcohol dehydrogenase family protein [Streptomyces aureoverticillatus]QIB43440.1 zinc-dependent alcohol dehydrogenase family protein [Streptomyces aureoverticillatus]